MKEYGFFRKLFSSRILPSWTILLFDLIIVVISVVLAYIIRFGLASAATMG